MSILLKTIFLSLLPISELRGGIPFAVFNGMSPLFAYLICVLANICVIPIVYLFLTYLHNWFLNIKLYNKLFLKYVERKRGKVEKYIGTKWEFLILMLFVAIPLPITGAYTGTLLAWLFKVKKKEAFLALALGVVIAGVIVSLVTLGLISGAEVFVK
ncbi:small multi-drug export protein [Candidatus Woesearchaeota archaeon]|jgi:uncharacterized membrane protein|nr:small multi-drug export protein [Candidatus Woesearchaeota archaeon]MBT3304775.1 small multi-drug export protein [Candidatus Woesearchaeota archaeon]MBT4367889.1 small multi-drug export protein [Candidatus Woesearchaeota archaeon]MBT4712377.1 small multi-drug export protein [Candidatus Woesearchaeota archaeon]MBT6639289.1 small multi-drug export protein [Candidatus Woesearchaeota archaeon]